MAIIVSQRIGTASDEYMLPDCFGFPASLPSILAHSGYQRFFDAKTFLRVATGATRRRAGFTREDSGGHSFQRGHLGRSGRKTIIAALNPLSYGSQVTYDLSKTPPPPPGPDPSLSAQQNQTDREDRKIGLSEFKRTGI